MTTTNKIIGMGVINITPNSFSDGGKFNTTVTCKNRIEFLTSQNITCLDIGAESSAPMNDPIDYETEIKRFNDIFFKNLSLIPETTILSIDTYHPETFKYVYQFIKEFNSNFKIIWNDVSGIVDDVTKDILTSCPDALYCYCHSIVKDRDHVLDHMKSASNHLEVISSVNNSFNEVINKFTEFKLIDRLILDPAFGFSKTCDQNWTLMHGLDSALIGVSKSIPIVIGISRKSFLKAKVGPSNDTEMLQALMLHEMILKLKNRTIFIRLHDSNVFNNLLLSL